MVQIYRTKQRQQQSVVQEVTITSLDLHGQGVGRSNGLVCFVPGALPGERVTARLTAKGKVASGRLQGRVETSSERIAPRCDYVGRCGGCQLQHLAAPRQLYYKEAALKDELSRAGIEVGAWQPPLTGPAFGYRRTMRLAIHQGQLGLRAVGSQNIIPINHCEVADPALARLLPSLQELLATLKGHRLLGHLELLHLPPHTAALWRLTGKLPKGDLEKLIAWAQSQNVALYTQQEAIAQHWPEAPVSLGYPLDGLALSVGPADFIQVNGAINTAMVAQAMAWLAPTKTERVLDAYSGLGNFSLPLCKRAKAVVAVEGVAAMTARNQANAKANGLDNLDAQTLNLDDPDAVQALLASGFDAALLDPARPGAQVLCQALAAGSGPGRVLYVSCNPATWKRDAALLIDGGYRLVQLGLMDMFSQTAHVELMALFIREG
ncbi:MAG: 23S rRNA (uracil(1939)-C(5))-methyltransferase RlmD [Pseudomonadota bacterium]|uniref:23S rRNA (uracil(1939)-C(5))-methyltransferase RlmD n=1 Tax=Gallaecimonas pentaromativorans TaxID=584787 RepID=UPI00067F23FB|nr:23S rRNA (uracil(1939)-C(5))-methyltransferase RlmD [Gallaecimonas pentaromativorans]MED5526368.1 23S rRNA (uracil(1939)-C(5))-methyltransferase RlmD [Pseudomonadota bacterium]